jgi:hypothetical protein
VKTGADFFITQDNSGGRAQDVSRAKSMNEIKNKT